MKQDLKDSYKSVLNLLERTDEVLLDFIEMVKASEEVYDEDTLGALLSEVLLIKHGIRLPIKNFLQDLSMVGSSSDIQNSIDNLPDDEDEDIDEGDFPDEEIEN